MPSTADVTASPYIVLYGSLMSSFPMQQDLGLHNNMTLVGPCELPGKLYDLGEYPGLIGGSDGNYLVSAELYHFSGQETLTALDDYEDYKPDNEQESLYVRTLVNLYEPSLQAWVYIYNRDVLESNLIKSGSWKQHLLSKKT